jgi:putative endonuclease
MYFVYVLHSLKDSKLYIGYSKNIEKRIAQHMMGKVVATKHRLPLQLIYYEAYLEKQDAKGREKFLKGGSGHKYLKKQLKHYFSRCSKSTL